jgi:hypothetical protein
MKMPELTCELYDYEKAAFERKRKPATLSIEVDGDEAVITGPASVLRKAMDLNLCHWVQFNGFIRVKLDDPIPHKERIAINAVLRKAWRKKS